MATVEKRFLGKMGDGDRGSAGPRRKFWARAYRKGQKRFEGFDEKIIAMYARGMTVREIQGFLLDQYKVEVGSDFISTVTDSVLEEVQEWQNRPLERMCLVVFFDASRVKIRDEGTVRKGCLPGPGNSARGNQGSPGDHRSVGRRQQASSPSSSERDFFLS